MNFATTATANSKSYVLTCEHGITSATFFSLYIFILYSITEKEIYKHATKCTKNNTFCTQKLKHRLINGTSMF